MQQKEIVFGLGEGDLGGWLLYPGCEGECRKGKERKGKGGVVRGWFREKISESVV